MSDDLKLLKEYAETRNADAFAELARRHSGLVYGACLRVIGNEHDAEDVSQECFLELARNAGSVDKSLSGWLHFVATRRSKNAIRSAAARRRYEELAMANSQQSSEPAWGEVAPHIDDAIEQLPDDLRLPVLLHYLEGRSQAEVAEELSVDQSTVSRRIDKGIGRLREHLRKAGFVVSAGVLATLLSENAATAAPAVVTAAIGKIAVAGVGQAWSTAAATAGIAAVKMKVVLVAAALAVAAAGAVVVVKNADPKADPGPPVGTDIGPKELLEALEIRDQSLTSSGECEYSILRDKPAQRDTHMVTFQGRSYRYIWRDDVRLNNENGSLRYSAKHREAVFDYPNKAPQGHALSFHRVRYAGTIWPELLSFLKEAPDLRVAVVEERQGGGSLCSGVYNTCRGNKGRFSRT